jgi:hypothetical protein
MAAGNELPLFVKIRNGVGGTIDRGEKVSGFLCTMVAISLQKGCKMFARKWWMEDESGSDVFCSLFSCTF